MRVKLRYQLLSRHLSFAEHVSHSEAEVEAIASCVDRHWEMEGTRVTECVGRSVLDIGCGLAVADVLLAKRGLVSRLWLLDGDGARAESYRSFETEPWFDVAMAVEFVRANHPRLDVAGVHDISSISDRSVGLAMSLRAWGIHCPVSSYVDDVARVLAPDGIVILDVRDIISAVREFGTRGFCLVDCLTDSRKFHRLVFRRHHGEAA